LIASYFSNRIGEDNNMNMKLSMRIN